MMRFGPVLAVLALAACSDPSGSGDEAPMPETPIIAASGSDGAARSGAGTLRGQVSDLTGDTSDLSTRVSDMGTIIDLPSDALFDYDEAVLTPAAQVQLRKAAELIRGAPPGAVSIIGHTDGKGDDAYNQRLSEARASAVAAWFRQQPGIRQRAFEVSGRGETAPIAPNETTAGADDPAGRAKNRRVEVIIPNSDSTGA